MEYPLQCCSRKRRRIRFSGITKTTPRCCKNKVKAKSKAKAKAMATSVKAKAKSHTRQHKAENNTHTHTHTRICSVAVVCSLNVLSRSDAALLLVAAITGR